MSAAAFALYCFAGVCCSLAGIVVLKGRGIARVDRAATASALFLTGFWCLAQALLPPAAPLLQIIETIRNVAWTLALFRHFANDGRDETLLVVRPVVGSLMVVLVAQVLLTALLWNFPSAREVTALLHMLLAVGSLVLVHNLFSGAAGTSRPLLAWNSAGMALLFAFDLNLYTVWYLTGGRAPGMDTLRAFVTVSVAACFVIGVVQRGANGTALGFRPSRAIAFNTISLAILTAYFLAMVGLSNAFAGMAGDFSLVTQAAFLLVAASVTFLWLPNRKMAATWRVLLLKHLFKHRYDYRAEWLRFAHTIGKSEAAGSSLQTRAVRALADITDSPAGLLLAPDEDDGTLTLAAHWSWPSADVPAFAPSRGLARVLEERRLIIDFDEAREGTDHFGELAGIPPALIEETRAWAGVPLLHGGRLVGLVVLARPLADRRLDWEDFDLLEIVGQQIASYLAEQAGQAALRDAARFDEFNRRMAFVMHDIKNLSSQLSLLARNAGRHADNPEFRADMLLTLRNSSEKLDALVSRLGRYGKNHGEELAPVDLAELARRVVAKRAGLHAVEYHGEGPVMALAHSEPLEQALEHLVQNAVEASTGGVPVIVSVDMKPMRGEIAVRDAGTGMSAEFIRNGLFRPFVSTKEKGFGIGAIEARDLVQAMGGRLSVVSREGDGSCFTISLPAPEAAEMIHRRYGRGRNEDIAA